MHWMMMMEMLGGMLGTNYGIGLAEFEGELDCLYLLLHIWLDRVWLWDFSYTVGLFIS